MVGLGTMGRNLLLNIADHGASVAGYDLDPAKGTLLETEGAGRKVQGFSDIGAFVASLRKPRAVMMLVPAGAPVDSVIASLSPFFEEGDFMIDGGNSFFKDTERRLHELSGKKLGFMGIGISGGESGARHGPSMMAGGTEAQYDRIRPLLEAVAAKAEDGTPCVARLGPGAAGHYVKMVHNGIEYGLMQLISECYDLMKRGVGLSNEAMAEVFSEWCQSEIDGFLLQITVEVLRKKEDGQYLVDLVLDKAKQKGTGKWTSQDAMDLGIPLPTIDAAVAARELSGMKDERVAASKILPRPDCGAGSPDRDELMRQLKNAMYVAMVVTYAQGFALMREASIAYKYDIDPKVASSVWRAGCIIRSALLKDFFRAYTDKPDLPNLMVDPHLSQEILKRESSLRFVVTAGISWCIPVPALMASLGYLDCYASERMPANLIQGQRDYFGAHTYERTDKPGTFHTQWGQP